MRNLKALARMPAEPTSDNFTYRPSAKHPNPLPRTEPDPALIWFFDSSKQFLVFRDTQSGNAAAWSEDMLTKSGWNMLGIRSLPRVSVQG